MNLTRWFFGCLATLAASTMPAQACYTPDTTQYTDNFGITYTVPIEQLSKGENVSEVPETAVKTALELSPARTRTLELKSDWFAILGDHFFARSKDPNSFETASKFYTKAELIESRQKTPDKSKIARYSKARATAQQAQRLNAREASASIPSAPAPITLPARLTFH